MKNKCENDHRSLMEMLTKNIFMFVCVCEKKINFYLSKKV